MHDEDDTPPRGRETPPERPSARRTPVEFTTPTPKPYPSAPRPPAQSPRLNAAELLDKAERSLRRPGWELTDPGGFSTNAYVKRKAKLYAVLAVAAALLSQAVDHTLPLLFDLYEKHLDRQTQRLEFEKEHH